LRSFCSRPNPIASATSWSCCLNCAIGDTFRAILTQPVDDDGVTFDVDGLEAAPIREDLEYGGVRVRTQAMIAGARIPIQVDVGFGDAITPGPIEIDYPALLDAPAPHLRAYPIETVVAEKFHALATRGILLWASCAPIPSPRLPALPDASTTSTN
jgi:hypothetical protein